MTEPRLRLSAPPRLLTGAAWGVHQPVLLCSVVLLGALEPAIEALRTVLDTLVEDPHAPGDVDVEVDVGSGTHTDTDPGTSADHTLLVVLHRCCMAIQREQNLPAFGRCRVLPAAAVADGRAYVLAMPCQHPTALRAILAWGIGVANGATFSAANRAASPETLGGGASRSDTQGDATTSPSAGRPTDPAASLQALREQLRPFAASSTNSIHFLAAAHALGLPITPLASGTFQIGFGAGSRWINSSITDRTPYLGVQIARRKDQTSALLQRNGLPVPQHRAAPSEAAAVAAARALGFPVVVKPADQEQGRGVHTRLRDEEQVRRSWRLAREWSQRVLVEAWHVGDDYRITVAHGRVVKVMHRRPGSVLGDGQHCVRDLVQQVQAGREQQRAFRRSGVFRLALDGEAEELLAEQGLQVDSVPAAGREVLLRRKANISAGGSHRLVEMEKIHPDNLALALRAAALLRLDLAGIDLISTDIAQAWHRNGAVICEVNAQPQLGFRDLPQLYTELVREMVGPEPAVAFHGLLVDHRDEGALQHSWSAFADQHGCNAWSGPLGAWLAGRQLGWAPADSVAAARMLLMERDLRAAFLVLRAEDVVQQGLPVDRLRTLGLLRRPTAAVDAPEPVLNEALQMSLPHADRLVRYSLTRNPARPPRPALRSR